MEIAKRGCGVTSDYCAHHKATRPLLWQNVPLLHTLELAYHPSPVQVFGALKGILGELMKNPIAILRTVALIEGISFLVLLFIAMPLKYMAGQPLAVRIVGMAHGVLFVIFCISLLQTWIAARWPMSRAALIFTAAIIPFGPWLVDRRLKNYEAAFVAGRSGGPR